MGKIGRHFVFRDGIPGNEGRLECQRTAEPAFRAIRPSSEAGKQTPAIGSSALPRQCWKADMLAQVEIRL